MQNLEFVIGSVVLSAQWESTAAPLTCEAIQAILPFESRIIQARWSGESAWVPMGNTKFDLPDENPRHTPLAGQILLHRGDDSSETEILLPYGLTKFACRNGNLIGNHFATLLADASTLAKIGETILWSGAQVFKLQLR